MSNNQKNDPTFLTIFGFTGDLSKRKLLPALYRLEKAGMLGDDFHIIGPTRRDIDINELKEKICTFVKEKSGSCDMAVLQRLVDRFRIVSMDVSKASEYYRLQEVFKELDAECSLGHNRLFYFALPPGLVSSVIDNMVASGVHSCGGKGVARLLIEKPFGHDFDSARMLVQQLEANFSEEEIYRIDHYLAKETVQNLLYFRFRNPIIRDLWRSDFVHHIQITVVESIGVEGRANFYEQTGALRDVIQSHLLQLMAITTMDEPDDFSSESVRAKRAEVLTSIMPIESSNVDRDVVRGQYRGYREEVGNRASNVETYVALKAMIDTDKWRNIPVYMRAGKSLNEKVSEIKLVYKDENASDCADNYLTFHMHPDEGISLKLQAKKPGFGREFQDIIMDYSYDRSRDTIVYDAYEKLIIDSIRGDQTLFPSTPEVLSSWQFVDPIIDAWRHKKSSLVEYESGSQGPREADDLLDRDGAQWL